MIFTLIRKLLLEPGKRPWKDPWQIRPVHSWGDHGAWEFGGKIAWPEDEESMSPCTPEHLISEPEQVDELPDPDPEKTEWFRLRTQFNDICVQKGYSPLLPSGSIMGQMASTAGATNLMVWMVENPDAFHRLAEKVMAFNVKMAKTYNREVWSCSLQRDE